MRYSEAFSLLRFNVFVVHVSLLLRPLCSVKKLSIISYSLHRVELYLYDRALKSEAVKPPSTYREPLKNKCRNVSKIIEKRRLATSTPTKC